MKKFTGIVSAILTLSMVLSERLRRLLQRI